jgi:hypothetical protein
MVDRHPGVPGCRSFPCPKDVVDAGRQEGGRHVHCHRAPRIVRLERCHRLLGALSPRRSRDAVRDPGNTEELHQVECAAGGTPPALPVAVVPLWHEALAARAHPAPGDKEALKAAKRHLDAALGELQRVYPLSPAGIVPQVA